MTNDQNTTISNPNEQVLGPVILDVAGCHLTADERSILRHPYVGGVIFFLRNFESPEQISILVKEIRSERENILIAVDQEGGRVQRFRAGFSRLPSLQRLGAIYLDSDSPHYCSDELIREAAWLMASELLSVGVDISFAPVVDADDCISKVIGDRSFSKNVDTVSRLGRIYLEGMHAAGMATTLKHFPGHGSVEADSHLAVPVDERKLEELWNLDLKPFRDLLPISDGVMPAHILFKNVDSSTVGFSKYWLQTVLRGQLQYKGVIFSDDLSMEGASLVGDHRQRAVAALSAGCDSVVICNYPQKAIDVLEFLQAGQWPINNRLALMKPKINSLGHSLSGLQESERWKKISKILLTLEG